MVDTQRYPLSTPTGAGWKAVVSGVRHDLRELGCSVLPGFIRSSLVATLRLESSTVAPLAFAGVETVNVYNTLADPSLPDGHPARTTMQRGNAFVARENIPAAFVVHQLYTDPKVRQFIAGCFELTQVYELADPFAGLCINVMASGREHPWHFDKNELTVSLLISEPDAGGTFEYCPNIRSVQSENFDEVGAVLDGRGGHRIRRLALRPGDLQLFKGRYSLHRVSPVEGRTERHSAIFAYSECPGVIGTTARTRQLFGRILPAHRAAEDDAVRVDYLLD
ncbi:MAG: arpA protein [Actinomycetota bacterium]|nr:arpA protein [Actinomycetota bacterium]